MGIEEKDEIPVQVIEKAIETGLFGLPGSLEGGRKYAGDLRLSNSPKNQ